MPGRQRGLSHRLIAVVGEWAVSGGELSDYGAGVDPQALAVDQLAAELEHVQHAEGDVAAVAGDSGELAGNRPVQVSSVTAKSSP